MSGTPFASGDIRVFQKNNNGMLVCTEVMCTDELECGTPEEAASFLVRASRGDTWFRRCLSPLREGDVIEVRGESFVLSENCSDKKVEGSGFFLLRKEIE